MCTVSVYALKGGYLLGMNRDELLTRQRASPPKIARFEETTAAFPMDPGEGTWISVNDTGACLALLNWHAIKRKSRVEPVTRGVVVKSVAKCTSPGEVEDSLHHIALRRINPFRLIGVFPEYHSIHEWRWDLKELDQFNFPWASRQWASSGFDEGEAQNVRSKLWGTALAEKGRGKRNWLRALHSSHLPERGPFSVCMHREDAATLSYTEIVVDAKKVEMRYRDSAPCEPGEETVCKLKRRSAFDH